MEEKKPTKVAVIGGKEKIDMEKLRAEFGDDVIVVDAKDVADLNNPFTSRQPMMITAPEIFDPRIIMDDDWSSVPRSDRRGTNAKVRNSKEDPKIQRNDPCPCGSGKKYKKCCGNVK